ARRAQTIQADLRDARLRLAADDLVTRKAEFDDTNQAETTLRREHDELTQRLEGRTLELDAHESAVEDLNERADAAQ
ncbi:chromosome segregation protein, partial [Mycobacterium sp. ITM-2017-0098]